MEQKHRNILQTSFVFLTKNIYNVEAVCDYLEMDEILTSGMVDEIKVRYIVNSLVRLQPVVVIV
jgi:hypothetical protein